MQTLTARALNRALLARQLLLDRHLLTPEVAVEHLVGLQAQNPGDPYVALQARLDGFDPESLGILLLERRAVRIALMRSTIHLVTARDCLALRALLAPVQAHNFLVASPYGRQLAGVDFDAVVAAGRAIVEARPRTMAQLGAALAERWPERDAPALAYAVRNFVPLVQTTPRGVWGRSGQTTLTSAESWLGVAADAMERPSLDELVLRYLAAFGPASVRDAQTWSGLTQLADVVARLRPRLAVVRDARGVELFDLPDAPRPDADVAAPVRFLPMYDNVFLSHADRARIIPDAIRPRLSLANGYPTMLLVDGFIAGTWRIERARRAATLSVSTFVKLTREQRRDVEAEGFALLALLAADAETRDVRSSS